MGNTEFRSTFLKAQKGDEDAIKNIINLFEPLVYKSSFIDGKFSEDLFQELRIKVFKCIKTFELKPIEDIDRCLEEILKSINM